VYPENIGPYLSIDETSVSLGELYTIVTNKNKKGKKGSIVAIIKGTSSKDIIPILLSISSEKRFSVKEVTLDMAGSMNLIIDKCFPRAMKVIDRFHVQKLAYDAVQQLRIKHRWEAIEEENNGLSIDYSNGDSKKQLLARGRFALYKSKSNWTVSQATRAGIMFQEYPDIKLAYELAQKLSYIYENSDSRLVGLARMARWFNEIEQSGFKVFKTEKGTFERHYENIINYFERRNTNASAESFNAKIKNFRRQLRGVKDTKFFLFRLSKIYA